MWNNDHILEVLVRTLRAEELRLREEQSVHGLDRCAELALHAVLRRGFESQGFGAFRERVYPCAAVPRSRLTERQRCDLVLTRSPALPPLDPDEQQRAAAASAGTLFAHDAPPARSVGCPPEEAFWLELKLVGQFAFSRGVPVPNATYTSELVTGLSADLHKLAADPMILHGAAALVLFNSDVEIADHDVRALRERAARRGPARTFLQDDFEVLDRIGNRVCTVIVVPVR
ncbi:MAG: hypothetical protein IT436_09875 [Phycisphaerales bacterium]|nr:hypothetical protein [Phycisphaerales bacterium]